MPLRVINVLYLGRVDYSIALELQQTLVRLVKEGRITHTLLLLEHPPVITMGRNAGAQNIVVSREFLATNGVELHETDRGGDVTFHGPGQLVGYPIFDLRAFEPRVGAVDFVRKLEETLIRTCGDLGVVTERIRGLTGVWTQKEVPGKIAAIGVHISRAVTSHGFALNVNTNLDYFKLIVPCGIPDKPVTSLEQEMAQSSLSGRKVPALDNLAQQVARNFGRVFEAQTLWLESLDALFSSSAMSDYDTPHANQDTPARSPREIRELGGEKDIFLA
ncbi:MAG TPA: lipoyl(octanoyl) transferase LipB [Candidatus Dormibacteraeota bacterium]|jgi:lipoyl(octanoyl) transferase|nr:lipoyl(octanoyl) transferase LipB [Candidatus Dormibacteraeota bacterium]